MDTESVMSLKRVIDFLRAAWPGEGTAPYRDWTRIEEGDSESWRKDEFKCELHWQEAKLYEMKAQDFLGFAKEDTEQDTIKARCNALHNADQAVRCRVDELLIALGISVFSSRRRWDLLKKKQVLETFAIPGLEVLKTLITSKRNRLQHEYVEPKPQEVKDAVGIAELFLPATREYVERGCIASATMAHELWSKPALLAATWFGGQPGQSVSEEAEYGYEEGYTDGYHLTFDLEHETITVVYFFKDIYRRRHLKSGKARAPRESPVSKEGPVTIPFCDCRVDEVIDLMTQLREKGGR